MRIKFSAGINTTKRAVMLTVTALCIFGCALAQTADTVKVKASRLNFIVGFGMFLDKTSPMPRIASDIGIDYNFSKNKKYSITYRNFYNLTPAVSKPVKDKNILYMSSANVLNFCYKSFIKKNYIQLGLGVYKANQQSFIDQYLFLTIPDEYGIEFSFYTKLKWLNVGYRRQLRVVRGEHVDISVDALRNFSICIEIPFNIK